jgi:hypothetical protein
MLHGGSKTEKLAWREGIKNYFASEHRHYRGERTLFDGGID